MPFEIVRRNLAEFQADAIVTPASPAPEAGAGIDAEIHKLAGPKLLKARQKIGPIAEGNAVITNAYHLRADYVIHAVSPSWKGGSAGEEEILRRTYESALNLADLNHCSSVAFPLLAAGEKGFPKELAQQIAIDSFRQFLMDHEMRISLVVQDRSSFQMSPELAEGLKRFIAETYALGQIGGLQPPGMLGGAAVGAGFFPGAGAVAHWLRPNFEDLKNRVDKVKKGEDGFSATLLRFIDRSERTDPDVYKHANVDRRLFSKIRTNRNYKPTKEVAMAFAISLQLDMEDTQYLLMQAGYALSPSSITDTVVTFCIQNSIYDIFEVNSLLFDCDGMLLGSVREVKDKDEDEKPVKGGKR